MPDNVIHLSDLVTVAAMVGGFGILAFMFRIQRELDVQEISRKLKDEGKIDKDLENYITKSDCLIIISIVLAGLVIVLVIGFPSAVLPGAAALCVAAVVMQCFYIFSILAHYGFGIIKNKATTIFNRGDSKLENWLVCIGFIVAALLAIWSFYRNAC